VHDGDRAGSYATSLVTSLVLVENLLPHPLMGTPHCQRGVGVTDNQPPQRAEAGLGLLVSRRGS
jgi:hypothetical protein